MKTERIGSMNASELMKNEKFVANGNVRMVNEYKGRYKFLMSLGRVFPTTKAQAKEFLRLGVGFGLLTASDVRAIEALCEKYGMKDQCLYQLTGSNVYARLLSSFTVLEKALRAEYNL